MTIFRRILGGGKAARLAMNKSETEIEFEWLQSEEKRLSDRKSKIEGALRQIRFQIEKCKDKIIAEYLEDGVCPVDLIVKKVPPKAIITDESCLPKEYIKIKEEINKAKINADIKGGVSIPGVTMDNGGYTIAIR